MVLCALILLLAGFVLGRMAKVLILVPATLLAWAIAGDFARLGSASLASAIMLAFAFGACLQLGYFAGGLLWARRAVPAKKPAVLPARR